MHQWTTFSRPWGAGSRDHGCASRVAPPDLSAPHPYDGLSYAVTEPILSHVFVFQFFGNSASKCRGARGDHTKSLTSRLATRLSSGALVGGAGQTANGKERTDMKTQTHRIRIAAILVASIALVALPVSSHALSLASSYKAPLTQPYDVCNVEDSTTDCTASYSPLSPWTFAAGTVEIDDTQVSLRLDDIKLWDTKSCSDVSGDSTACKCWNDVGASCTNNAGCGGATECGPSTSHSDYFTVRVYLQNYYDNPWGGSDHLRRGSTCYVEADFDVVSTSGNRNRQVNSTITQAGGTAPENCGYQSDSNLPEVRHVEVVDKFGNIVAVVGGY